MSKYPLMTDDKLLFLKKIRNLRETDISEVINTVCILTTVTECYFAIRSAEHC